MSNICKCETPPFYYLNFNTVSLGENDTGQVSLETCKGCGVVWINLLIEEPHYSRSGRWWRGKVELNKQGTITLENAKEYIESLDVCFAGGSFYEQGIHNQFKPICIK